MGKIYIQYQGCQSTNICNKPFHVILFQDYVLCDNPDCELSVAPMCAVKPKLIKSYNS